MATFVGGKLFKQLADSGPERGDRAFGSLTQQSFELGKEELDRVEVGRVRRQEEQFRPLARIARRTPAILCAAHCP